MFELDKYDKSLCHEISAVPVLSYDPVSEKEVVGMSFLHWGEHCVECAAPDCYASCDLYQPRSDMRCRRFAFGAYKNLAFSSLRGYGVEVSFKKWAKIEAFGNTSIHPIESVLRWERLAELAAPVLNVMGLMTTWMTGNRKFGEFTYIAIEKLSRKLHERGKQGAQPVAFLLEVYNPTERDVQLQIIFNTSPDDVGHNSKQVPLIPPTTNTVSLSPGYSRHEFPMQTFRQFLDLEVPFQIKMLPANDETPRLIFLTADLVMFKHQPAAKVSAKKIKCIVWDLDNTLWKGTLVESDDVFLNPGVADLLKYFDDRGILLSVVSKNDYDPAWEKLKQLGVAEYFLYPQIDWLPKSQKIKNIAKRLNIALDTFAFIDDNQFELAEVSSVIPEVLTIPSERIELLKLDPRFQGSVTNESRQRRKMYQEQVFREEDQQKFGEGYTTFLASCAIVLTIDSYSEDDRERVSELVQRTNQLNFSGSKYSRNELDEIIGNPALGKYVLKVADKYGSYGTVGFCLVSNKPEMIEILDFMLSCRVQSKFIEQAFFSHLIKHHNVYSAKTLWVNFHKTERNTPAQNVLSAIGFKACDRSRDGIESGMILHLWEPLECDFIEVHCLASDKCASSHDKNPSGQPKTRTKNDSAA